MRRNPKDVYIDLEKLLYSEYIKYDYMQTMTSLEFQDSNAEEVNVFIDLYHILGKLYVQQNYEDAVDIIYSCIRNMISHYKHYFWSRHRVHAEVIFVYANASTPDITRFIPEYDRGTKAIMFANSEMDARIEAAMERVNLLIPYIRGAYLKTATTEFGVVVKNLCMHPQFAGKVNILISSSQYTYCVPGQMDDYCVVYRLKTIKKEDNSFARIAYSYNPINAINAFVAETRNVVVNAFINPKIITPLMVLNGIPAKGIKSTKDVQRTLMLLSEINDETFGDIELTYETLAKLCANKRQKLIDYETFYNRYVGLSLDLQLVYYMNTPQANDWGFLTKLEDPDEVKHINGQYFRKYPLNFTDV
jgi:hypothetical protein